MTTNSERRVRELAANHPFGLGSRPTAAVYRSLTANPGRNIHMRLTSRARAAGLATTAVAIASVLAFSSAASAKPDGEKSNNGQGAENSKPIDLQLLAVNDFHGALETQDPSFGSAPSRLGGAAYLAAHLAAAEAAAPGQTLTVSAGDLIGATPLVSALFHDEPTIEAANLFGLDIAGVGNHEFDEGAAELLRMQNGGTHPVDGDLDGDGFGGADFEYLSANVTVDETGETLFAPYKIVDHGGVRVAYIGMTLEGTPNIVTPSGVAGLTFHDEVETVNTLVPELQKIGIEAFVVLLHEGGFSRVVPPGQPAGYSDCSGSLSQPLATIVPAFDPAVDVVITGHTNHEFICTFNDAVGGGQTLVTMADNNGRIYTDIDLQLNRVTKDITVVAAKNVLTTNNTVTPVQVVADLVAKYKALSAPLENRVIGSITADIPEFPKTPAGESPVGNLIADAQLAATVSTGGAQIAFMNPGGIRTDFGFVFAPPAGSAQQPGEVTYGEAFAIQPFGNAMVTMTLTGSQIEQVLEQQWPLNNILSVSAGFTYAWSPAAPVGSRIDPSSIKLNGVTLDPSASYRVTVNSFLADGGDGFSVLRQGTNRIGGDVDTDTMEDYFLANSPVSPPATNRISLAP